MNSLRLVPTASDFAPFHEVAERFPAASGDLRDSRDLLRRVDTKFLATQGSAAAVLAGLSRDYAALTVPTGNVATYRSLYFDTDDLRCFHDHRRGRRLRHKIRIRHYHERHISFLEIKTKRNDTVTDKQRLPMTFREEWLGPAELAFLRRHVDLPVETLRPMMRIDFQRLNLLGLATAERVTIDVGITAEGLDGRRFSFGDLVVVEVKQSPFCVRTPVMRALHGAGLRESSMSKYTVATALLRPEQRRNRLLPGLREIERML